MKGLQSRVVAAFLVFVVSLLAYWDEAALNGEFVYDDSGTVTRNKVVAGYPGEPWSEVWKVDFWGEPIANEKSHKSYRPITTFSFKANVWFSGKWDEHETFGFHLVNVLLHCVDSALVALVADFIFQARRKPNGDPEFGSSGLAAVVSGLTFGLHPVHSEAVCNVTGRAELLMSFFYLLGLLFYTTLLAVSSRRFRLSLFGSVFLCVVPLVFTSLSLLSKEQGFTLCISCVVLDYSFSDCSVVDVCKVVLCRKRNEDESPLEKSHRQEVRWFVVRTVLLAVGTLSIGLIRLHLNGESKPNIIPEQNPAAFAEDFVARLLSTNYVYWLYIYSVLFPHELSCDWSGNSIELVTSFADVRVVPVIVVWIVFFGTVLYSLYPEKRSSPMRRVLLSCVVGMTFVPFLLSSNLIVKIGTMKAERIIYLPSSGFCLLLGFLVEQASPEGHMYKLPKWLQVFLFSLYVLYVGKLVDRNYAWSNSLNLWDSAYRVNPKSSHTRYNYGLELTKAGKFLEAIPVLRSVIDEKPLDFPTRYIYGMNFRQLQQCTRANKVADEGLDILKKKRTNSADDLRVDLSNDESLMLTLKSYCASTIADMSKYAQRAVEIAPRNEQAIGRVKELIELASKLKGIHNP